MILRNREMRKHSQAQKQHSGKSTQRCSSQIKHYLEQDQVSSNSHVSTCCSNCNSTSESPQKSYRNLDENDSIPKLEDPLGYMKYSDFSTFLPLNVCGMKIVRPTWDQFSAIPNPYSGWKAHCFWNVGYTFDINMKKMKKSNNIRYRLTINVWCLLSNRSWVKYKWERLLEHETGHYLLGCLCALEFKNRADKFKYTKNYRMECTKIFQETFQEYLQLERRYDEETSHSQDVVKQKEWNLFIKQEFLKYS